MKGAGGMQYAIEATINADLPYDLRFLIESTLPATFTLEVYAWEDGSGHYTRVWAKYGGGAPTQAAKNNRAKLQRDLVKQVGIYGGIVTTHECYHEEGLPCVIEEVTKNGGAAHAGRQRRAAILLER
jgi:hypothetical protein